MGRLREELLDPWGGLVAGVAGGLAWAVVPLGALALPVGVGVAAVVYGVKVGAGMLSRSPDEPAAGQPAAPRPPRPGSLAERELCRAEQAYRSLAELVGAPAARDRLAGVRDGAAEALTTVRRLAGQVAAVEDATDRVQPGRLEVERERLAEAVRLAGSERVRADRQRSLDSVTESLAVAARLAGSRDELLARMQAIGLGLEGLVAKAAEVLAMSEPGGIDLSADRLAELDADLDGLRAGLAEADAVSRRVLDG